MSIQVNLLMNRIDEAKRDFERAVEYNPNFGIAYVQKCYTDYRFAIFNRDLGLAEAAVRDFERAFEKYPDPPECIYCYILYAQVCIAIYNFLRKVIELNKINDKLLSIYILIHC